ncbi:MAG: hypothetical protein ACLP8X_22800 [Streptosporangiaceae bacterium]
MTTVRIAHAEPRPGRLANGGFVTHGHLVVLADDAGHRAVPIWMRGEPGESDLSKLLEIAARPPGEIAMADAPEELTVRLLRAAGASVTGVDIDVTEADTDELTPQVAVARIGLAGPAGTREVTVGLGLGLAMAAAGGVPVRMADALLDRVATAVPGDDLLGPFLDRVPPVGRALPGHAPPGWPLAVLPGQRPRYEPCNLSFTDGLDRWDLDSGFRREADPPPPPDYAAAADGPSAILSSAVPRPAGSAALVQAIFADDYRGATVVFRGEIRTEPLTEQAGLRLEIVRHWWRNGRAREDHGVTVSGGHDWTRHEITALIPGDADLIRFGIGLVGPGRIALRNPELRTAEPRTAEPLTAEPRTAEPASGA